MGRDFDTVPGCNGAPVVMSSGCTHACSGLAFIEGGAVWGGFCTGCKDDGHTRIPFEETCGAVPQPHYEPMSEEHFQVCNAQASKRWDKSSCCNNVLCNQDEVGMAGRRQLQQSIFSPRQLSHDSYDSCCDQSTFCECMGGGLYMHDECSGSACPTDDCFVEQDACKPQCYQCALCRGGLTVEMLEQICGTTIAGSGDFYSGSGSGDFYSGLGFGDFYSGSGFGDFYSGSGFAGASISSPDTTLCPFGSVSVRHADDNSCECVPSNDPCLIEQLCFVDSSCDGVERRKLARSPSQGRSQMKSRLFRKFHLTNRTAAPKSKKQSAKVVSGAVCTRADLQKPSSTCQQCRASNFYGKEKDDRRCFAPVCTSECLAQMPDQFDLHNAAPDNICECLECYTQIYKVLQDPKVNPVVFEHFLKTPMSNFCTMQTQESSISGFN